jgi:hypothetical protein
MSNMQSHVHVSTHWPTLWVALLACAAHVVGCSKTAAKPPEASATAKVQLPLRYARLSETGRSCMEFDGTVQGDPGQEELVRHHIKEELGIARFGSVDNGFRIIEGKLCRDVAEAGVASCSLPLPRTSLPPGLSQSVSVYRILLLSKKPRDFQEAMQACVESNGRWQRL